MRKDESWSTVITKNSFLSELYKYGVVSWCVKMNYNSLDSLFTILFITYFLPLFTYLFTYYSFSLWTYLFTYYSFY